MGIKPKKIKIPLRSQVLGFPKLLIIIPLKSPGTELHTHSQLSTNWIVKNLLPKIPSLKIKISHLICRDVMIFWKSHSIVIQIKNNVLTRSVVVHPWVVRTV